MYWINCRIKRLLSIIRARRHGYDSPHIFELLTFLIKHFPVGFSSRRTNF